MEGDNLFMKKRNKKFIAYFDRFLLLVAIVAPMTNLPQLYKIFSLKDATGVSLFSWILYALFVVPWIIYGILHKDKPITITNILWFITNSWIAIGVFIYG